MLFRSLRSSRTSKGFFSALECDYARFESERKSIVALQTVEHEDLLYLYWKQEKLVLFSFCAVICLNKIPIQIPGLSMGFSSMARPHKTKSQARPSILDKDARVAAPLEVTSRVTIHESWNRG